MDYKLFNAEEFAADESFINYYLKKDEKDVDYWTSWISRHPEKLDEVLTAERLLALVHLRLTDEEQDNAFSRFDEFINLSLFQEEEIEQAVLYRDNNRSSHKLVNFRITALAASIVLMLSIGILYLYKRPVKAAKTEYVTIHNNYGMIRKLLLADGTQVSLNANSSLSYPKHFKADRREVKLSGEAFFEVSKDKTRPFTVTANGTKTRVLGTKFNINAYTEQKTTVALLEGSVAFGYPDAELLLKPSDMVTYTKKTNKVELSTFNVANVTAWTTGVILFSHASFADVAAKFKNSYGIELKDSSRSGEWNYSGTFNKSDYLTIIKSICFAKNLSYKQYNHRITLKSNHPSN